MNRKIKVEVLREKSKRNITVNSDIKEKYEGKETGENKQNDSRENWVESECRSWRDR